MRDTTLLLGLLLAGCPGSEPEPDDPQQKALAQLEETRARLQRLEAEVAKGQKEVADAKNPEPPATIGELAGQAAGGPAPASTLVVSLQGEDIRVGDQTLSLEQLRARFDQAVAAHADPSLVVRADADVEGPRVAAVMDAAKAAGIERLAVATPSPQGD